MSSSLSSRKPPRPAARLPRSAVKAAGQPRWYWLGAILLWLIIEFLFQLWPSSSREAWAIKHLWLYAVLPASFLVASGSHHSIGWHWNAAARRWSLICCALALPVYVGAALFFPGMQDYYPMWPIQGSVWGLIRYVLTMLVIVGSTEFLYRGVMLLSLSRWSAWSILFHLPPYVWIHVGKPPEEVLGSVLGGLLWGWAALRSGTIYPGLISHTLGWMIMELWLALR